MGHCFWKEVGMRKWIAGLLLALVPLLAPAKEEPSSSGPPTGTALDDAAQRPELLLKPSLHHVGKLFAATGLPRLDVWIWIHYDEKGVVTDARMGRSSGNAELDDAILAWGKGLVLTPGKAGEGRIPFELTSDDEGEIIQPLTDDATRPQQ